LGCDGGPFRDFDRRASRLRFASALLAVAQGAEAATAPAFRTSDLGPRRGERRVEKRILRLDLPMTASIQLIRSVPVMNNQGPGGFAAFGRQSGSTRMAGLRTRFTL
jgi:hypothetical protein